MMAITLSTAHGEQLAHLRIEPTVKRVRARLGDETVLDSRRAVLVWEPHRVVPTYAVPLDDIGGAVTASSTDPPPTPERPRSEWDPRVPFSVRLTPGRSVVISGAQDDAADGFIADDPDLEGYVILDFSGFTTWLEDEDIIISHPHDPYARIDIRQSSLHLEYRHGGVTLVDTTRAKALYETYLPVRYYVPPEDVVVPLEPSDTITFCSYKGRATYYSPVVAGTPMRDLAWSYTDPLVDALGVKDHIAFFDEKLDLTIDGVARPRPITPWS
jgi:uncharacterized protein (DUF427 family)